jgi:hypothetical protein
MSDLSDKLRQVADDGASQARPPAVTDVIRQGNRRRRRTIAQRSIGGLSVAGISAAAIFSGAAGSPASPAAAAASSAARGVSTLTERTASTAGTMTMVVRYRGGAHQSIRLLTISYSLHSTVRLNHATVTLSLKPAPNVPTYVLVGLVPSAAKHSYSGSLSDKAIGKVTNALFDGATLKLALTNGKGSYTRPGPQLMQEGLILP